jgi:glycosyltransferase involved in cell wall biosynthesis
VTVSTQALCQLLKAFNRNVVVLPNFHDINVWSANEIPQHKSSTVKILYMGTRTHQADFALVENALLRLKENYGEKVEIEVVGVTDEVKNRSSIHFANVPFEETCSYPGFVKWLIAHSNYDIGIAPLVEGPFNRGKSIIKYIDYSALNLAVLCSNVEPYKGEIKHLRDGLLVENTEQDWYKNLKLLVDSPDLMAQLKAGARDRYFRQHTLDLQHEWTDFLSVLDKQREGPL